MIALLDIIQRLFVGFVWAVRIAWGLVAVLIAVVVVMLCVGIRKDR